MLATSEKAYRTGAAGAAQQMQTVAAASVFDAIRSELSQLGGNLHDIRRGLQRIRARVFGDMPEEDPPPPQPGPPREMPAGALGALGEQIKELHAVEGMIRDHWNKLQSL